MFVLVLAATATLKPGVLGIPFSHVIVAGDSMLPTMHNGDLVVMRRRDTYARGDVVAYRAPTDSSTNPLVIHRIVAGNAGEGYILKGDNRTTRDPWQIKPENVLGQQALRIPKLGLVFVSLREPAGFAALAAALSFFIFVRKVNRES